MEEKRTIPLPADPLNARRKRTIAIAAGAVVAVAVGVVSVVAVAGGSSPHKPAVGEAAATENSSPYATDSGGGYSQQPSFTWSARAGLPPGSPPTSKPSSPTPPSSSDAAPPPTGPVGNPVQSTSAAPPPSTVTKVAVPPKTSAPPPPPTSKAPTTYAISGTVSCVSGHSVEGVWVQAAQGSGYSPWQGIGNGSTSRYWYTLPSTMSFSLHVGCGGTTASWGVALTTQQAPGPVANFTCHDVSTEAEYGTCDLQ